MEHVTVTWADQHPNDALCDQESIVTARNFNVVPNASGTYTGTKPTITIDCTDTGQAPTGFSWTFDIGGDNWPTSMTVVAYYQGGGSTTVGGFYPQAPTVYDTWTNGRVLSSIVCTINSAHKGGEPLKFSGFHFGKCFTFGSDAIRSMVIQQSADFSGCSAPYSTLNAVVYGRGAMEMISHQSKILVWSDVKGRIGTYYVTDLTSTYNTTSYNKRDYFTIKAVSALGVLAEQIYPGVTAGSSATLPSVYRKLMYNEVLKDISPVFLPDPTPFGSSGNNYYFGGLIPDGLTRRDALARIANSLGYWVDEDCNVKSWGTSGSAITISKDRTFAFPVVSPLRGTTTLDIYKYGNYGQVVDGASMPSAVSTVKCGGIDHWIGELKETVNIGSTEPFATPVAIQHNYAAASVNTTWGSNQALQRKIALTAFYSFKKTWRGRIVWNTATKEGKCGTKVTVYTNSGGTFTGLVTKSTLHFSGGSIVADLEVIGNLD